MPSSPGSRKLAERFIRACPVHVFRLSRVTRAVLSQRRMSSRSSNYTRGQRQSTSADYFPACESRPRRGMASAAGRCDSSDVCRCKDAGACRCEPDACRCEGPFAVGAKAPRGPAEAGHYIYRRGPAETGHYIYRRGPAEAALYVYRPAIRISSARVILRPSAGRWIGTMVSTSSFNRSIVAIRLSVYGLTGIGTGAFGCAGGL